MQEERIENIRSDVSLKLAGLPSRALARLIDFLIVFVGSYILTIILFVALTSVLISFNINGFNLDNLNNAFGEGSNKILDCGYDRECFQLYRSNPFLILLQLISSIVLLASYFIYFVLFPISSWRATPGKKLLKLKLKSDLESQDISIWQSITREIFTLLYLLFSVFLAIASAIWPLVSFLQFLIFISFITALFNSKKQTIADLLAKTSVLVNENKIQ